MSFNSLYGLGSHSPDANLEVFLPLLDSAASTTVLDYSGKGRNGTLIGGDNTSAKAGTGPNSWLTSAFTLNGTDDAVDLGSYAAYAVGSGQLTVSARWLRTSQLFPFSTRSSSSTTGYEVLANVAGAANTFAGRVSGSGTGITGANVASTDGVWVTSALVITAGTGFEVYKDGALEATTTYTPTPIANSQNLYIGRRGTSYFAGKASMFAVFSREWSGAEAAEDAAGPEPICSSAPSLSGTETEGQILSCTNGTWGLPSPFASGSNGTITYTRQWTRSNSGSGSGESDILGATSSTYTLQAGDVGKYIRCRVRASNDGGFDSAADTSSAFTGAIASAGGGARRGDLLLLGVGA